MVGAGAVRGGTRVRAAQAAGPGAGAVPDGDREVQGCAGGGAGEQAARGDRGTRIDAELTAEAQRTQRFNCNRQVRDAETRVNDDGVVEEQWNVEAARGRLRSVRRAGVRR